MANIAILLDKETFIAITKISHVNNLGIGIASKVIVFMQQ